MRPLTQRSLVGQPAVSEAGVRVLRLPGVLGTMKRFDQRVLDAIASGTAASVGGITQVMGCTPNKVAKAIMRLRQEGHIERDSEAGLTVWKVAGK